MIPLRLRLSGFLSYLEPVDLDLTGFRMACISGANGAGKSSLLDAITWALFGEARRRDDSVIHTNAPSAEVTLDFQYETNTYRVLRVKPRNKTTLLEFYLRKWPHDPDSVEWMPLTEKNVSKTEERIRETLRMDYETFTNASFFLQGRADQFAVQRPGDRKRILASILGLDAWEQYRAEAAEQRKGVESNLRSIDAQIEEIDAELAQEAERAQKLKDAEERLQRTGQARQAQEAALAAHQRLAASLEERRRLVQMMSAGLEETRARVQRLETARQALESELETCRKRLENAAQTQVDHDAWRQARAQLEELDALARQHAQLFTRRAAPHNTLTAEESRLRQEARSLGEQAAKAAQESARAAQLTAQLAPLTAEMTEFETRLAERAALQNNLHEQQGLIASIQAENTALREEMRRIKDRLDRLNAAEAEQFCPLCGQPLGVEERAALVASLESDGRDRGDRYRANQESARQAETALRAAQEALTALERVETSLRNAQRQHGQLEAAALQAAAAAQAWAETGAPRLAAVEEQLNRQNFAPAERAELAAIDAELAGLGYDPAAHERLRQTELAARGAEAALRAVEAARASLAPLEKQHADLLAQYAAENEQFIAQSAAHQQAESAYQAESAGLPDLRQVESETRALQTEENRLRMEVGMVRQAVAVLENQRERRERLSARRAELTAQIARYKVLERAFGKDGVPALLIEQALPEIEEQANDVLNRLSSGVMRVRFETQRGYKDKSRDDQKETLDIVISDTNGERAYEMFSGGETFRVNFAIRLALSRVLAQRAGARLQTLVIDEGFGSQDAAGRQRLIEAINLVRDEFERVLVITHLEELKDAFPARIEVEKTVDGSHVQVVL